MTGMSDAELRAAATQLQRHAAQEGQRIIERNSAVFDAVMGGAVGFTDNGQPYAEQGGDPAKMDLSNYFNHSPQAFKDKNRAYVEAERAKLAASVQPPVTVEQVEDKDDALQAEIDQLQARIDALSEQFSWNQMDDAA